MNKIFLFAGLLASNILVSSVAQADDFSLRICEYVQANDKNRLRTFLKQNKLKIRNIYDDLECNGSNILIFAAKSQSLEVGEFIIGNLPLKKVQDEVDNLSKHSAHLAEAAKNR